MFRERRSGGDLRDTDPRADVVRQRRQQVPIPTEEILDIRDVVEHRPADDHAVFTDRVAAERERGDNPEVAAASSQRPEQVRMRSALAVTKRPSASTTSADRRLSSVSPKRRGEVADSAAEGQAPNPVVDMKPEGSAIPNAPVA